MNASAPPIRNTPPVRIVVRLRIGLQPLSRVIRAIAAPAVSPAVRLAMGSGRRKSQLEGYSAAFARTVSERAALGIGQPASDPESEASRLAVCRLCRRAVERREDLVVLKRRHPGSFVADAKNHCAIFHSAGELDRGAWWCMLERIVDEIDEDSQRVNEIESSK